MPGCAVYGCRVGYNALNGDYQLHCFPKREDMKKEWIERMNRENYKNKPGHRICSKHFEEDCFVRDLLNVDKQNRKRKLRRLKPKAIPTLYMKGGEAVDEAGAEADAPAPRNPRSLLKPPSLRIPATQSLKEEIKPPSLRIPTAQKKRAIKEDHIYAMDEEKEEPKRKKKIKTIKDDPVTEEQEAQEAEMLAGKIIIFKLLHI